MFGRRLLFFRTSLLILDLVILTLAWLLAYHLRLTSGLIPVWKGIPPIEAYLFTLLYLLPIWGLTGAMYGLYRPSRGFCFGRKAGRS